MEKSRKNEPSPDSFQTEAFESIVELYYQIQGYITSSNKWFSYLGRDKQQPGWQDIDIIAINRNETLIIDATVNLKSKIALSGAERDIKKRCGFFKRVNTYLEKVPQYSWLVNGRNVKWVLAYEYGYSEKRNNLVKDKMAKVGIELISSNEIIEGLIEYVRCTQEGREGKNLKTNNPLVMLVRLVLPWLKEKDETA